MSLYHDYCVFTGTTAVYPQHVAAEYLALGLCSEAAECVELLYKRNGSNYRLGTELGSELGDVAWYTARLAYTYEFDFAELVNTAKKLYATTVHDIETLLAKLTVEAGLIAGKVKKQLRDGHTWNGEQREDARTYIRVRLIQSIVLSMHVTDWLYAHHSAEYSSYDKLLKMNRMKLESRQQRGVLRGDGNQR